ncbi:L,D-transpeptidase family protein [Sphingobium sp. CR2-8]|uniref:L,D-transpeptidase family protein n=1 Tax=Sphingobium sp. CR2-8 TaxID=1306534 RepID=UPI002DBFBCC5|nr:L,D-transpeptidase family protein [Sphingobium sp. CR2-8]MEC3911550.1 L,D-transpeptidase family protein [Sphingobium sp. CR2-8]
MAGFLKGFGPKLAIGGIVAMTGLIIFASIDRSAFEGQAAPETATETATTPAAAQPPAPAKAVERRSDQGMAIDPAALRVKRVLKIDGPFRHGDYAWDENGAPKTGPVIITVDLRAQTLSVFRDGYEIGAAVILYGATDKPSPKGAFPIMAKHADYFSRTYNNAPMPFAQRLTSDGVFIHGSDVQWGRGTHGCIGVPKEFAQKLFGVTKLGDMVVITDGKMLDVSKAQVG